MHEITDMTKFLRVHHGTPRRQTKQSNQFSLPHQNDCKIRREVKYSTTKHRTITDSNSGRTMGASFVHHLWYFCLFLLCFHARLFVEALWSPAGKGLTSWLSFVMSNCDVATFTLISWVRCGAWLYLFLFFALFLTFTIKNESTTAASPV